MNVTLLHCEQCFCCVTGSSSDQVHEVCSYESFNATCPPGDVILMTGARYGRLRVGRCLPADYFIGCETDVLAYVDGLCSGRQACLFRLTDSDLIHIQNCRVDLQSYLEATYDCVTRK